MNRHSAVSGRRTSPQSGEKRERILAAAVRVFADKGFYNAKVADIASLAGVADGTIYLYFKSKDDLLISLFEDRMEQVITNARGAVEAASDAASNGRAVEKLRRLIRDHLDLVQKNPQLAEVLTVELRQSSKFLKEYKPAKFGEFLKLIARPIEEGQRDGSIGRHVDPPVAARAIFGALDELVLAWVLGPRGAAFRSRGARAGRTTRAGAVELTRAGEDLADLFIEGLRTRPDDADATQPSSNKPREERAGFPSHSNKRRTP